MPTYGTQVVVQSKKEKELQKMLKKVEKKKKYEDPEFNNEYAYL